MSWLDLHVHVHVGALFWEVSAHLRGVLISYPHFWVKSSFERCPHFWEVSSFKRCPLSKRCFHFWKGVLISKRCPHFWRSFPISERCPFILWYVLHVYTCVLLQPSSARERLCCTLLLMRAKSPRNSCPGFAPSFFWHCILDFSIYMYMYMQYIHV